MIQIYGLKCPVLGVIRYVGKSKNPERRFQHHIGGAMRGDYNHHTARWIRKLLKAGHRPELVILRVVRPDEKWQDIEREVIAAARQAGHLTNSTAGGEGLDYIDPRAKAQYTRNLSAAMKKIWSTSERKVFASQRAHRNWSDPEFVAKRAIAQKASLTEEVRAKISEAGKRYYAKPGARLHKSRMLKEQWDDPAARAARLQAINVAALSEGAKRRWSDPAKREALLAVRATPESRARLSASARKRSTPEYRAMMAEKTRASWAKRRLAE